MNIALAKKKDTKTLQREINFGISPVPLLSKFIAIAHATLLRYFMPTHISLITTSKALPAEIHLGDTKQINHISTEKATFRVSLALCAL